MKPGIFCGLLFLIMPLQGFMQDQIRVTFIANEGFIVERDSTKIVMDGFFNTINGDWCSSPSPESVEKMRLALPPFDHVDLITVSHNHIDHFDSGILTDHLLHNKQAMVLGPDQVFADLKKNPHFKEIQSRFFAVTPSLLSDTSVLIAGIPVRILRLEHSHYMESDTATGEMVNRHRNVENLGFCFDVDGHVIFHSGDTNPSNEEEYATFALEESHIDIAFLDRMFLGSKERIAMIDNYIRPEYIVFMHIDPAQKSMFLSVFAEQEEVVVFEEMFTKRVFSLD